MGQPALADFLEDFGERGGSAGDGLPFAFPDTLGDSAFPQVGIPQPEIPAGPSEEEIEERIREAVTQAEAEVTARLSEQYEAMLASERERHAAERASLERELGSTVAAKIAAEFTAVQDNVASLVSTVVSRILGPLLGDDVTRRSLAALAEALKEAIADAEGVRVRITGSQALYEALCELAGDGADRFDFTESASTDLSVRIDDSIFETRIAQWSIAAVKAVG